MNTRTLSLSTVWPLAWAAVAALGAYCLATDAAAFLHVDALAGLLLANAAAGDLKPLIEQIQKGFHDFREANDARLTALEKSRTDSDFQAKLAKIETDIAKWLDMKTQLDRLEAKSNRAGLGGGSVDPEQAKYKSAFYGGFVRKGDDSETRQLEGKAMSVGSGVDGGVAVPEELDRQIEKLARDFSPMRSVSRVITVGTSNYKKLVNTRGASSGWVGETASRPETNTPQWVEFAPSRGEIYANPQVTQQSLDDIFFDVEAELVAQITEEFTVAEGSAFTTGDGTNKPKGFLSYTTAATSDASRAYGTIEHVPTGVAGNWPASNPADVLIDLIAKMKRAYRMGSNWMMSKSLMFEIMKFKDTTGQYLWQPSLQAGMPINLLGFPVLENEDMPAKAANALAVAFGNFQRGYLIEDRMGMRMLRDPYTNKPFVGFYTTKRVGGGVINSQAIKVLRFAAS